MAGAAPADPIPAFLDAAIDAAALFGGCELRVQLSSSQESAGLAAVLLVSGGLVPTRCDAGTSGVVAGREELFAVRPMDARLASAWASQVAAQLSAADEVWPVGGDDDCSVVFADELKFG
jgi:hypothetical protein